MRTDAFWNSVSKAATHVMIYFSQLCILDFLPNSMWMYTALQTTGSQANSTTWIMALKMIKVHHKQICSRPQISNTFLSPLNSPSWHGSHWKEVSMKCKAEEKWIRLFGFRFKTQISRKKTNEIFEMQDAKQHESKTLCTVPQIIINITNKKVCAMNWNTISSPSMVLVCVWTVKMTKLIPSLLLWWKIKQ